MTFECKTFPNENAAVDALNAAHVGWIAPTYADVGSGRHVLHSSLPPQVMSVPQEMINGRWAVVANHPSFKGEFIVGTDIKGPPEWAQVPQSVGAESGIVERPAAKSRKKAV